MKMLENHLTSLFYFYFLSEETSETKLKLGSQELLKMSRERSTTEQ